MATNDGPARNDFDRRQEPFDPQQETPSASASTNGSGPPPVPVFQINPKLVGCGCFVPSAFCFLLGCVGLLLLLWGFIVPDWRTNNRYVATSCEVLDKRLDSELFDVPGAQGKRQKESYRPAIKIRYEVRGRKFEVWAYDSLRIYTDNQASQQAIVDSFQVGMAYPCWYDPDRPDQVVLVRGHVRGAYIFLILPIGLLTIGATGLLIAWKVSSMPPRQAVLGFSIAPPTSQGSMPGLQYLPSRSEPFDPSSLGDPLALKTDWTPVKGGGALFVTRRLLEVDPDRMEYRPSPGFIGFGLCLVFLFLVGPVGALTNGLRSGAFNPIIFVAFPVILATVIGAGYAINLVTTPIVFDRRSGLFWKGRVAPDEAFDPGASEHSVSLQDLIALQVIRANRVRQEQRYELNLVRKGGERINVVSHGDPFRLRADAATLSAFLQRPVWDALG